VNRAGVHEDVVLLCVGLGISMGIVAGMFLESSFLTLVAVFAAFAVAVLFPSIGLVVLAFMAPLKPPLLVPAPGFNTILVAAILVGCLFRLPISRPQIRIQPALLLLFGYVLYVFAQQLPDMLSGYAGTRSHDVGYLFFQLVTGLGAIVAIALVLKGRSPYPALVALLLSATFAALLGILTSGDLPYAKLANLMPVPDVASRAAGPFGNPNSFGQLLAYAAALAAGWFATTHSRRVRLGLTAAVGVMAYALSLSLSRGAIAALVAGLVMLAFARSRRAGLVATAAAVVVVTVGYPTFVALRLTTEAGSASVTEVAKLAASDEGRLSAVLAGPALFATSPIFGIGFGQYKYFSGLGLVAHNWYGTVLAEQGLVGIILWVLMLVAVWVWLRTLPARPRLIGRTMFGAVVVGCLFLEPPTSFQTSVLPAMVLTACLVADWTTRGRERVESKTRSRPPAITRRTPSVQPPRTPRVGAPI